MHDGKLINIKGKNLWSFLRTFGSEINNISVFLVLYFLRGNGGNFLDGMWGAMHNRKLIYIKGKSLWEVFTANLEVKEITSLYF